MARAIEITLLLILIQASIGFVNATGLFTTNYYANPSNEASSYTVQDLASYNVNTSQQNNAIQNIVSQLDLFAFWAWESFVVIIKIIFTVAVVFPALVNTFHIPAIVALFLQGAVYYYYALFYGQWKSGKPIKFYE